jgi:hypothetical protein
MHLPFNLLRTKGIYMFRALVAHPQEALHKRHLVYCVRVMSVGCTRCSQLHHTEVPTVFAIQVLYYWKLNWLRFLTAKVNLGLTIFPNFFLEIKTFVFTLMLCHYKLQITKRGGQTDDVQYVHKPTPTCPCRLPLKFEKNFVFHISQTRIYNRLLNIPQAVVSRILEATFH